METGIEKFQDGDRRLFAYFHYQIPTTSSARTWTAIRPNVFFEMFRDARPLYYSPAHHVTVGTMFHTIRRPRGWLIESEINPQPYGLKNDLQWRLGGRVSVPLAH